MTDKHAFLSDGWFDAAAKLIDHHSADGPPAPNLVMNLEVTDGDTSPEVATPAECRGNNMLALGDDAK